MSDLPESLPQGYPELLAAAVDTVRAAQVTAARRVNHELVLLYLDLGRLILDRQDDEGYGTRVIHHLSADLRATFPGQRGFSERNLRYCRTAARMFPDPVGQQLVAQLPWGHVTVLTDRVDDDAHRRWYARQAATHGWSRNVLEHHISTRLHQRVVGSPTPARTPVAAADSDLVRELVKDPYRLDFLDLDPTHTERQLEDAIAARMTAMLTELGPGFAFVGRQVPLQVGSTTFYVDLLFYHLHLRRYVVFELKTGPATPEAVGKLGFYLTAVDEQWRRPEHGDGPSVGILLTGTRDDLVVEYALRTVTGPMAAVTYTALPDDLRDQLPSPQAITTAVTATKDRHPDTPTHLA
ncbi:PDDEXK nuclease domain-containing protein (plasmid) [Arsenicicoccus dermatophilus]|uniref:PDDEXK nuclease domain-containing protein n=2 Tax=Arsenicicoccus dermatophilus TaxID=1076331 RepID=UPI0038925B29